MDVDEEISVGRQFQNEVAEWCIEPIAEFMLLVHICCLVNNRAHFQRDAKHENLLSMTFLP